MPKSALPNFIIIEMRPVWSVYDYVESLVASGSVFYAETLPWAQHLASRLDSDGDYGSPFGKIHPLTPAGHALLYPPAEVIDRSGIPF